jgi:branched-chain amino acid transport system permease protein
MGLNGLPRRLAYPVALIVLAALPLFLAPYPVGVMGTVLAFALVVVSVDVLTGLTGLPTLAQVAYFGVGAYTAGLVSEHLTTNLFAQLLVGTAVAAAVAAVTGAFAVRTSGIVFLMVTLAIGELIHRFFDGWEAVGASDGMIVAPGTLYPGGEPVLVVGVLYWWSLFVFVVGFVVAVMVSRSPLGRSMRAVRESPTRLEAVGQHTYIVKLAAYVIAGGLAGAAGTAWVAQKSFFAPGTMGFGLAALALLSVVLGGAGTLWGPVLGAAIVIWVRDWMAPTFFVGGAELLLGVLFVIAVFTLPRGIAGIRLPARSRTDAAPEDAARKEVPA